MIRMPRFVRSIAVCGVLSAALVSAAQAGNHDKVLICHGTASETNPYVVISVDEHALAGHFDGTAPGHGPNNHPDLPVNPDGTCGDDGEE